MGIGSDLDRGRIDVFDIVRSKIQARIDFFENQTKICSIRVCMTYKIQHQ